MKRYVLSPVLATDSSAGGPDIARKLATRVDESRTMSNIPPHIRPQPLIKYSSTKWSRTLPPPPPPPQEQEQQAAAAAEVAKEDEDIIGEALQTLPAYAQNIAEKFAPHLFKVYPHGEEFANLLYDLTVKRARRLRTSDPDLLRMVIDRLRADPTVPPEDFVDKLGEYVRKERTPAKQKSLWK